MTPVVEIEEPTIPATSPVVPAAAKLFVADNKAFPLNVVLVATEVISWLS